jgi:hypothetical protein
MHSTHSSLAPCFARVILKLPAGRIEGITNGHVDVFVGMI